MIYHVYQCSHCPSTDARWTLHGEHLCDGCISRVAEAAVSETGALVHELPTPVKGRPSGRKRENRRLRAERAAIGRLKLAHLPEYQAIYAEELHREGLVPPAVLPFDIHLRKLAGKRLAAVIPRSQSA